MGGSYTREEAREGELMTRVEKAKGEAKKKKNYVGGMGEKNEL